MTSAAQDTVRAVIGLEIHVQLATETKLFCGCANRFGAEPNTLICPVCLGLPGALPVLNRRAVELGIRVGLALGCRIPDRTKWDRKGYYYPDLPKNYQISQYDHPLCVDGRLDVPSADGPGQANSAGAPAEGGVSPGPVRRVRIRRAHIEEDAGKNVHDHPAHTGVDLNRAGVPLLEIVSEPDMRAAAEVVRYAREIQRLVRWLEASEANMEMGQIRFEPNVNLHITRGGRLFKTPIAEVKNLNSFRSLETTVEYEIERQYEEWREDPEGFSLERLGKQNRGFDAQTQATVYQREKEEAHDYRYFPDPDLVPLDVGAGWAEETRNNLPELPWIREARYRESYGLAPGRAGLLTQEKSLGDLLDEAVSQGASPKTAANLLLGSASALANARGCKIADLGLSAEHLAELTSLLSESRIVSSAVGLLLERTIDQRSSPLRLAREQGLLIQKDPEQLDRWIEQVLQENPEAAEDVAAGKTKALGFLVGQVMKKSRGKADPREAQRMLRSSLGL